MSLQQKILAEKMKDKRTKDEYIKDMFVKTGACKNMINLVREKAKPTIDVKDLPF